MKTTTLLPEAIQKWQNAIKSGHVVNIVGLYSKDAILLGTYAVDIKIGHTQIEKYFLSLGDKKNLRVEFNEIIVSQIGTGYVCNGLYTFKWEDKYINFLKQSPARFSFVVKKINGKEKIITHHSSLRHKW